MRFERLGLGSVVLMALASSMAMACGGAPPPVATPTSLSSSPPQPVANASDLKKAEAEAPPPAPAVVAEPSVLTEAQLKRDAAFAPKIAPFVDAYANADAELTKDRKKLLFRSNRDGVWAAYMGEVGKPGATPVRLTAGRERIASARFSADEKYVVYTSDQGADESFRIYRMNLDGSAVTNLTPKESLNRDAPALPRLRPTEMIYSARDNASPATSVYVQGLKEGDAPRKVYTDAEPGVVLDASPDGSRALYMRSRSESDQVLFRVDVDTGTATRLFPQSEKRRVHITSAKYSGDGKRVFLTTDDGGDASYVIRIEPGSGVISGRYKEESPLTAQVDDVIVSPKEDRLAIVVDAGNHTETRILDESLKVVTVVKSPLGTIAAGRFAADGKSFTAFLSTPEKPGDVFDVDATSGAMKALRTDTRSGLATLPKLDVALVNVQAHDGLTIPVNLYLPVAKKDRMPVIVSVHGGPAWSAHVAFNASTLFWTSLGYAVVEPNVRGSTGFGRSYALADDKEKREGALKDLETVNKWVRDQPWGDRDRIAISGKGYGGYMTLMALSRQPGAWKAGIDMVGVSDLRTFLRSTSGTIRSVLADEFGDLDKDAALLAQFSPITKVNEITAPLFVYQGQNDPRVPRSEGDAIVTALRKRNVPVEYMVAPNEGNAIDHRETKVELMARAARFLDENMPKSTAPMPVARN